MTETITIYPEPHNISPARAGKSNAPDIVNDDFFSSFNDVLAALNPLQHIPIISNLYRAATGDSAPSAGARVAGGVLFGGAIGFVSALVNSVVENETGNDIGGSMLALANDAYKKTGELG